MRTFSQIYAALRRKNRSQYALLSGCSLFSVMLITAYVSMMRSPTVLNILPEGGDSRKQTMAIFVLAVIGCGVFTTYASSLFFRFKSRETGIFMALGASRKQIRRQLLRELSLLSVGSCAVGALLGTPIAWIIWQLFRIFLIDTDEMVLTFDPQAYLFAAAFSLFTILMLFIMGSRFIRRTNIIDIVNEQRKSEPIRDVKPWYGPVGIFFIILGGFCGYMAPGFFIKVFQWYPPAWINITYLPLLIGLYMVLLHTIVRGWRGKKNQYKDIITHSMVKFQGRQTVRNMLVITTLLAGAYFAVFYSPMLGTGSMMEIEGRSVDYAFHYRQDQNMLTRAEIEQMAADNRVAITDWKETEFSNLGADGNTQVEDGNGKYHYEYRLLLEELNFLSESDYIAMTGQSLDVNPGKYVAILAADGTGLSRISDDVTLLTNPVTRQTLPTALQDCVYSDMLALRYYILDDADYANITAGLSAEWQEKLIFFQVADVESSLAFSKQLFSSIVARSGPECEVSSYYDRIGKMVAEENGEVYWGDSSSVSKPSYSKQDSSEFRQYWKYMPQFRVLDSDSFLSSFAVFLMLFIFIAIICYAAVLVIAYTRCMTIAINNRQVYEDLKRLGANQAYLRHSVRSQIKKVIAVPATVATILIYTLYTMIMFFNDNQLSSSELAGLGNCLLLIIALSIVLWIFYRFTLKKVCSMLNIAK